MVDVAPRPDLEDAFREARPHLEAYCRRRLGNAHDAADAVQETYAKAWRARDQHAGTGPIEAWLVAIARNVCTDVERARMRWQPVADAVLVDRAVEVDAEDDVDLVLVDAALMRLNARHRRVIELRELDGLTYDELAARQGLNVSSVKSVLWRAREALRREYAAVIAASTEAWILVSLRLPRWVRSVGRNTGGASSSAGADVVAISAAPSVVAVAAVGVAGWVSTVVVPPAAAATPPPAAVVSIAAADLVAVDRPEPVETGEIVLAAGAPLGSGPLDTKSIVERPAARRPAPTTSPSAPTPAAVPDDVDPVLPEAARDETTSDTTVDEEHAPVPVPVPASAPTAPERAAPGAPDRVPPGHADDHPGNGDENGNAGGNGNGNGNGNGSLPGAAHAPPAHAHDDDAGNGIVTPPGHLEDVPVELPVPPPTTDEQPVGPPDEHGNGNGNNGSNGTPPGHAVDGPPPADPPSDSPDSGRSSGPGSNGNGNGRDRR